MRVYILFLALFLLLSSCTSHGSRDSNLVALTFDDGPGKYSENVLDILAEHNVSATFFVQGYRAQAQPEVINRIVAGGHELGVHSWSHEFSVFQSKSSLEADFAKVQAVLPVKVSMFRPSYGLPSVASWSFAKEHNLSLILWDSNSFDYKARSASEIVQRTVPRVQGGSIILMHDGMNQTALTIEALPIIINDLRARGFEFTTVSKLITS